VTVGLVTDSSSQLPPELAERYGVEVVPITVVVDGVEHQEGVDLDADGFYARFADGAVPEVTTAQPGPGRFIEAYDRLAESGVDEILSIHVTAVVSGTLNSARVAAESAPVPVRLVDTGTGSFGISCCVWEAAEVLAAGGSIEDAADVAEQIGATVGNVFVVQALDLARKGGRVDLDHDAADGIPVLTARGTDLEVVGVAKSEAEAVTIMSDFVLADGPDLRVAVGVADRAAASMSEAMARRVRDDHRVREVVCYRVGPSVGVHTGPGTAGGFFYPAG
jgi:DegV family protein with EDD domain